MAFWVNISDTYKEVVKNNFLWAPMPYRNVKGHLVNNSGWSALDKVKPGDFFVCKKDDCFTHLAVAIDSMKPKPRPENRSFDKWKNEGRQVNVELIELPQPVKAKEVMLTFNSLEMPAVPKVISGEKFCELYASQLSQEAADYLLTLFQDDVLNRLKDLCQRYKESIPECLYPIQAHSWILEDETTAKKTVDETLIKDCETGIPNEVAHFFVFQYKERVRSQSITFLVNDVSFVGKLTLKPGNRLVLSIKKGRRLLALNEMTPSEDEIWFEAVDDENLTFRVYTKTSDEKNRIKPKLKYLKKPSKLTRKTTHEVRDSAAQRYFKSLVKDVCGNRCLVTGVEDREPSILIGSHIVPWSSSDDDSKLDGYNGLMLAPHIDRLFDIHLITFTKDGYIEFADEQTKKALETWGINLNKKYALDSKHQVFLEQHRRSFEYKKSNM